MKTIEEIRKALITIHHYAMGKSKSPYMSVPADPNRDADLILSAAIDELEQLRAGNTKLREALAKAQNGLRWYRREFPEVESGADGEMDAEIEAALASPPDAGLPRVPP